MKKRNMPKRQTNDHVLAPSIATKRKRNHHVASQDGLGVSDKKKGNGKTQEAGGSALMPADVGCCDSVSNRYEKMGRRLGEGTYGIVYQARDRQTGRFVALKRCLPHHEASDGFPVTTLREIQSLRLCTVHENIVQLENVAVSRSGVFLVFEYW